MQGYQWATGGGKTERPLGTCGVVFELGRGGIGQVR